MSRIIFKNSAGKFIRQFRSGFTFGGKNNLVLHDKLLNSTVSAYGKVGASRFELKYHINEFKAAEVCRYIQSFTHLDKYCKVQPRGFYPIVSLYLDSQQMHLCRESLTGLKNRIKLRIRSYTDEPGYPRFLEIKRRMNNIIIKSRSQIMECDIGKLFAGDFIPEQTSNAERQAFEQFQLYMNSISARPVVLVRYIRQAYEDSFHNKLRITFDRELAYKTTNVPELRLSGQRWQRLFCTTGDVVLEIKFTGHYPAWLGRMVKDLDLRPQSISKYVLSVEESCLMEFCGARGGEY